MAIADEHETADPEAPWTEFYAARILWMPESADIVRYLDATYGQSAA